ncbi:sodium/proton antiporter NhaB [Endozoicomonas sp. OPT23]|uniref:sodium/proton antiporter NhaB n=1 Tax=Endozoicomonas sp. OPT23 TaxID=2072845 RepID=UPI00129AD4B8|nr:sodium/proton antiporter NhaB [Endozoicomonas sp. OPT23]MRI34167.1 sodium/proton antiporter NhaB [Endozoicomonas sp. OPT23]
MASTYLTALGKNFLGNTASWYKQAILFFLVLNPVLVWLAGPVVTSWVLVAEFIFTLAMALKCYPLQPGGLLVIEAIALGLTDVESLKVEVYNNFPVILLLMFMVAGIYFMKGLLLYTFTRLLINVRSKTILSLLFCIVSAVLSAFLDALTVTAVLISVCVGFYSVYHRFASGQKLDHSGHDHHGDQQVQETHREELDEFRAFLRSLLMHSAVGTALGGVCTLVGEPQNLLIAERAGWTFNEFFLMMAPVTMPVLAAGLMTCVLLEKLKILGYGAQLPERVRDVLKESSDHEDKHRTDRERAALGVQLFVAFILIASLSLHLAEVGFIGLMVIILITSFTGIIEEHQLGKAFEEAMPFTALLVVFFGVVAVIHDQHLFSPIIAQVLAMEEQAQIGMFFIANGVLSMISDNVFVATIYINEVKAALDAGQISREHFEKLAVAINTGTNLPSIATPNGQAAFLFLLTSTLAPLVRLSYGRMVIMALPYTIVLSLVGYLTVSAI